MAIPRAVPGGVLFTSYNTYDLFLGGSAAEQERYGLVVDTIRDIGPDVLAIQEIRAGGEEEARQRLRQLAGDTGLQCLVPGPDGGPARPALALGSHGYHLGLLWRDGVEAVPGSLQTRRRDYWHALACVVLDVGGRRVRHASYHAPPFGRRMRTDESELLLAAITRSGVGLPSLVGADWNADSADRVEAGGRWRLYEPHDPYAGVEWFPDLAYQCEWDYDERGRRRHRVDRSAGEVLWAGGLHDAAAALRAPWQPTTGHHPDDPFGRHGVHRRIDIIRVTADMPGALRAHQVTDTATARRASDHLPVSVEYLPTAIGNPPPAGPGA